MVRVFPSITTQGLTGHSWRDKLREVAYLRLESVAVFMTGLQDEERIELLARLRELQRVQHLSIPFVHAVTRMKEFEYVELIENFGTAVFNLHPTIEYPLQHPLSEGLRRKIFIENSNSMRSVRESDLEGFAGMCIDMAHLEETRLNDPILYESTVALTTKYPIGANHLSAITSGVKLDSQDWTMYQSHIAATPSQLDYLEKMPLGLFSRYCVLEVENPIVEQIKMVGRINNMILSRASNVPVNYAQTKFETLMLAPTR